jgi:hypothetical protein
MRHGGGGGGWALSALLWRGVRAREAGTERELGSTHLPRSGSVAVAVAAARRAGCHLHGAAGDVVELVGGEIATALGDVDLILELVAFFFLSRVTAGAVVLLVPCCPCRHEFMRA